MNNKHLTWVATVVLIISILLCSFTLWYVITSKDALSQELKNTLKQLEQYNLPKEDVKDVTLDEAKLYLAIAKYCENTDNCKGGDGKDGVSPACIFDASQCRGADGKTPVKGIDYNDGITPPCYFTLSECQGADGTNGTDGQNGANGKPVLRRCNPETNRMEWQHEGDESWQPEYNLAPGQTCVTEE